MSPSELWWHYVPAGVTIRESIVKQIVAGRCVLLNASRLPWEDDLLISVKADIEANDAAMNWNEIDAGEIIGMKPLHYLGSFYGVDHIPVEQVIAQNIRQQHSCCWVRNIPESEAQAWLQMAKELFGGKENKNFRLVLELPSVSERAIGKIAIVDARVEHFDIYYFALSMLGAGKLPKRFQQYAATLCAELADGSVELCCALCARVNDVLRNPLSASGASEDEPRLKQLICRAQTRSISPLVDIGRLRLISMFEKQIEKILPQQDDYGNEIVDVNEVELRHLVYFLGNDSLRATSVEKEMLNCLYEARNDISHLKLLSYERIQKLFQLLDELA